MCIDGSAASLGAELETAIVCKYFLEAVEKKQYGWFWHCPNGGDACKYRHCLPEGIYAYIYGYKCIYMHVLLLAVYCILSGVQLHVFICM